MTNIPAVVNPRAPKRMVGCELLNLAAVSYTHLTLPTKLEV